jgi:hypothetical protein
MRISLFEDSVPYDSQTPATRPLGGTARAVVGLAVSLAGAGHAVTVFNRLRRGHDTDGIAWRPLDGPHGAVAADLAVAVGRPSLLARTAGAGRCVFWATGPGRLLDRRRTHALFARHRPVLAFPAEAARQRWGGVHGLETCLLVPGIPDPYRFDLPIIPLAPVQAIATVHPLQGMEWLIELWRTRIRRQVEDARLVLYSALLARGAAGGPVPDAVAPVLAAALQARQDGVVVSEPQSDEEMAFLYRDCRVHLHPAPGDDPFSFALADSQACGLPALARRGSAADGVIVDGETGYLAPDDEAFVNLTTLFLDEDDAFEKCSGRAREVGRARQWGAAVTTLADLAP